MKQTRRPKLTLKAAKALAVAEFGTAAGLTPHENNNADYQRYEMRANMNLQNKVDML